MVNYIIRTAIVLGFIFLAGFLFKVLWNTCLVPAITILKEIDTVQGAVMLVLGNLFIDSRKIITDYLNTSRE